MNRIGTVAELFRSCSNRRWGPMTKRWVALWCTNLIRFSIRIDRQMLQNRPFSDDSPNSDQRNPPSIFLDAFWSLPDHSRHRRGPSLPRSENYSNYSWIVLNSVGLNYSILFRLFTCSWQKNVRVLTLQNIFSKLRNISILRSVRLRD